MNVAGSILDSGWALWVAFGGGTVIGIVIGAIVLRRFGSHPLMMISLIYICLALPVMLVLSSMHYYSVAIGLLMAGVGLGYARGFVPKTYWRDFASQSSTSSVKPSMSEKT